MKPRILYRAAAVLLLLFTIGHTLGFREADPQWGLASALNAMQSRHFNVQGFSRTYWDFFLGAGFTVGLLYLFAALLAWQLGSLPDDVLARMRAAAWGFALCFAGVTVLSWRFLFWIPIVMAGATAVCLAAAAWQSGRGGITPQR